MAWQGSTWTIQNMSNFTQLVFAYSLLLTLLVGSISGLSVRGTRGQGWLLPYVLVATLVHLLWWAWPVLPSGARLVTRWSFAVWLGFVLAATALLPLYATAQIIARLRVSAGGTRLSVIFAGSALSLGVLLVVGGAPLRIREETVLVRNLDHRFDGFRIANFGDVHIDRFIGPADLKEAVSDVAARDVDVLAITGDLIDDYKLIEPTLDALNDRRIRNIVAVIGNHEKMGELEPVTDAYKRRKGRISLLTDSNITVHHSGARAHFVGIDYTMASDGRHMLPEAEQKRGMVRQASAAFPKTSPNELVIALSHHPEFFPIAASQGAQLTLSSHTHGGQVAIFGRALFAAYDYIAGRYEAGGKQLDVSAGFGHWLPLRLGVPREIVIVTLQGAGAHKRTLIRPLSQVQAQTRSSPPSGGGRRSPPGVNPLLLTT